MPTLILRKNIDNERITDPHSCTAPGEIQRILGKMTVEEEIASMLAENEQVEPGRNGSRKILNGTEVVGYIVVLSTDIP